MKIGKTELKSGLILAPMAGFSDRAMRLVCRKYGAEYTVTEMVSAKAVTFGDKKTSQIARIGEDECPVALQLFGSEPDVMAKATEMMSGGVDGFVPPVAIDINMGCPVNKIFSNGEGSALMRDPELIYRIVKATVGATDLPVTVKL
ncbi:MAG: tRNA-dihydrouridine synthase family protein, partial [Clostridia bacterium]|nr:tRNA-dihydrouridine synthase family protein [Clostridia bacterium]